jgi:hypothetical protein
MPGAMDTFLVGMNDEVAEVGRQPTMGWTAWDCYRRFPGPRHVLRHSQDEFDRRINHQGYQASHKISSVLRRCAVTYSYKLLIPAQLERTHSPADPVNPVGADSWYTERAHTYRKHLQIAEDGARQSSSRKWCWGT